MSKKVLVTEKIADEGIESLRKRGLTVDVKLDLSNEDLIREIPEYHALIVRSATKVTGDVIKAGKKLRVIGRAGVTIDNIDVETATEQGVIVCNAPTSNIVSAAEHTMALMLSCARSIPQANTLMHEGVWDRVRFNNGVELCGKTLAVFGLGRVGCLVAERARAFGMNLVGYDPYCSPETADRLGVTLCDDVHEVLPIADFITVHLPKTKETVGMFGPKEYAEMKDGVVLVNAARGNIFNLESLADFMAAGKIHAAGIDMFDTEPCTESPLHEFPNAILTPRLGASTKEAQLRAGLQTAEHVAAGLSGSIVPTAVNMAPVPPEVMSTVGPYIPACELMGSMLSQLHGELPQYVKLTSAGTIAGGDQSFLVAGTLKGLLATSSSVTVTPVNAETVAKRHNVKMDTVSSADAGDYASLVSILADGTEITCTLSGDSQMPRIVSLLGYKLDIAPAPQSLAFEYPDGPGRIGVIGTVLGENDINITTMQIGTKPAEQCALAYMNVEGDVTDEVLDNLREKLTGLKNLWHISL